VKIKVSGMPTRYIFRISAFIVLVLTILIVYLITISQPPKPLTTATIIEDEVDEVYRIEIHHPPYALINDKVRIWGSVELICPTNVTRLRVSKFQIVLANGRPLKIYVRRKGASQYLFGYPSLKEHGYYLPLDLRDIILPSGARKRYTFEVSFRVVGQVLIAYDIRCWWRVEVESKEGRELMPTGFESVLIKTLFPVEKLQTVIKELQEEKSRLRVKLYEL